MSKYVEPFEGIKGQSGIGDECSNPTFTKKTLFEIAQLKNLAVDTYWD
jgi:hypothetical protein